jgi:hypothetical protein
MHLDPKFLKPLMLEYASECGRALRFETLIHSSGFCVLEIVTGPLALGSDRRLDEDLRTYSALERTLELSRTSGFQSLASPARTPFDEVLRSGAGASLKGSTAFVDPSWIQSSRPHVHVGGQRRCCDPLGSNRIADVPRRSTRLCHLPLYASKVSRRAMG